MAEVKIERKEDFEKAMRRFKVMCKKEGIVKECRDRQYYIPPSQRRRLKGKKKKY
ncbi:30S ribosomal protein S21 [Candidatus Omnitrophota bacterium]